MLTLDTASELQIEPDEIARVAVLGASGMGKSNTVKILVREMAAHLPFTVIDPHGEYDSLREAGFLRVGRGENVDLEIDVNQASKIAVFSLEHRVPVVLDMLLPDDDERLDFAYAYCETLWKLNLTQKQPYGLVIDEAQNFIPETVGKSAPLKLFKKFALEGRKFGFKVIISSQRVAEINKTVLAECPIAFLHGVEIHHDFQAYQGLLPYTLSEVKAIALRLKIGQALVKRRGHEIQTVQMLKYDGGDGGETPALTAQDTAVSRNLEETLTALREAVKTAKPAREAGVLETPVDDEREIEALKAAHAEEIRRLQTEIDRLCKQLQGLGICGSHRNHGNQCRIP